MLGVQFGHGFGLCLSFPGQPRGVLVAGVTVGLFAADLLYCVLDFGDHPAETCVRAIVFCGKSASSGLAPRAVSVSGPSSACGGRSGGDDAAMAVDVLVPGARQRDLGVGDGDGAG